MDAVDAAIVFDRTVATMQQHYLAFDTARVADDVFSRIQNGRVGRAQQNGDRFRRDVPGAGPSPQVQPNGDGAGSA